MSHRRWLLPLLCLALTRTACALPRGATTRSPARPTASLDDLIWQRHLDQALTRIARQWPKAEPAERQHLAVLRADCYVKLHRPELAARALASVPTGSTDPGYFRAHGELSRMKKNDRLARQDFNHAVELTNGPEAVKAQLDLAELENDQHHLDASRKAWSAALELASALDLRPEQWVSIYLCRIDIMRAAGQREEALDVCRLGEAHFQALHYPRGLGAMRFSEAQLYHGLGLYARADVAWASAVKLEPDSVGPFLTWGFTLVFNRQNPAAVEHWLALSEKLEVDRLPAYERFYLRLLQSLATLFGLERPAEADRFLKMAERLAVSTYRPAGEQITISLRFDLFGPESSELAQVLYLRLLCLRYSHASEAQQQDFMRSRIARLGPNERAAWQVSLARSYLLTRDWDKADRTIAQALSLVKGERQSQLALAAFDAQIQAGRLQPARQLATIVSSAPGDLQRTLIDLNTQQPDIHQPLWEAGADGQRIIRDLIDHILDQGERRARLQAVTTEQRDAMETSGALGSLQNEYIFQAWRLAGQERWSEALVACQEANRLAEKLGRARIRASYAGLLGYLQLQTGEPEAGIATLSAAEKDVDPTEALGRRALKRELQLKSGDPHSVREASIENDAQLRFGRARAEMLLDDPSAALADLDQCLMEGTVYAFPVHLLRARALARLNRLPEALALVRQTAEEARAASSAFESNALALWHELDPSAPGNPTTAAPTTSWLTARDFQARLTSWLKDFPDLLQTVPVLPASLIREADRLSPGRALVEYYCGKHELVIIAAAREGFLLRRLEVGRAQVATLAASLRSDPDGEGSRNLHRILIDPTEADLRGRTLTIIASNPLVSLPWDLLRSRQLTLLEEHPWTLWSPGGGRPALPTAPRQILALGDVQNADLPATGAELEAIRRAFPRLQSLTGAAATLPRLLAALPDADVVHFATHGHADERPADSWIKLSDGRLRTEQIYHLPVKPGALVVLSTCESADPEHQDRAPVTLAAAFLSAGASQVIGSLTPVGDEETATLFGDFYRQLALGKTPPEALRAAKLARKASSPTQLDWASFLILSSF